MILLLFEGGSECLGTALAVDGAGNDTASVTCAFTAWIKACECDVVQHFQVARDAQR